MVYAEFGGQTECIMGNWKIENTTSADYQLCVQTMYQALDKEIVEVTWCNNR